MSDDYSHVMEVYNKLSAKGPEYKAKADKVMQEISSHYSESNPAPPGVIQKGLEEILNEHESHENEIPAADHPAVHPNVSHSPKSKTSPGEYIGLAGIVAAVAAAVTGTYALAAVAAVGIGAYLMNTKTNISDATSH